MNSPDFMCKLSFINRNNTSNCLYIYICMSVRIVYVVGGMF